MLTVAAATAPGTTHVAADGDEVDGAQAGKRRSPTKSAACNLCIIFLAQLNVGSAWLNVGSAFAACQPAEMQCMHMSMHRVSTNNRVAAVQPMHEGISICQCLRLVCIRMLSCNYTVLPKSGRPNAKPALPRMHCMLMMAMDAATEICHHKTAGIMLARVLRSNQGYNLVYTNIAVKLPIRPSTLWCLLT